MENRFIYNECNYMHSRVTIEMKQVGIVITNLDDWKVNRYIDYSKSMTTNGRALATGGLFPLTCNEQVIND